MKRKNHIGCRPPGNPRPRSERTVAGRTVADRTVAERRGAGRTGAGRTGAESTGAESTGCAPILWRRERIPCNGIARQVSHKSLSWPRSLTRASRCHPPIRQPAVQDGATSGWCHPSVRSPRMVPPASPEGPTGATRRFVTPVRHQQIRPGSPSPRMVPPGSWSPAGTAAKPKTVPPVSSDRRQPGATRQSGGANWCHPPVRHAGSSPADSAGKPETVP